MKEFDWEIAKGCHSERVYSFLKANHDKALSEEEFIRQYKAVTTGKRRSPSHLKAYYRRLKERYGFFTR